MAGYQGTQGLIQSNPPAAQQAHVAFNVQPAYMWSGDNQTSPPTLVNNNDDSLRVERERRAALKTKWMNYNPGLPDGPWSRAKSTVHLPTPVTAPAPAPDPAPAIPPTAEYSQFPAQAEAQSQSQGKEISDDEQYGLV